MFCKVCNTRLNAGSRACPNCGAANTRPGEEAPAQVLAPKSPDLDLELDEVLEEAGVEVKDAPAPKAPAPKVRAPAPQETQPTVPAFDPEPSGLREQLRAHPELLEKGLSVFEDGKGKPVGVGFSTSVGSIDLLARDAKGGLVVVMVAESDQGAEIVAEMLQRLGWVRKHMDEGREQPRGIVLMDRPPENLGYAAAAVTDTVAFKTYRVALTFEDVEL